jgi:outer membrane beta-barrel protein
VQHPKFLGRLWESGGTGYAGKSMRVRRPWLFALLLAAPLAMGAAPARAQPPDAMSAPEIPDTEDKPAVPVGRIACLDDLSLEGYQRKGVQKRDFLKRMKFEISGVGGFYASDVLSSTYTAGGAFAFFPVEDLGLELLVSWSPVRFRLEQPVTAFDRARRFQPGSAVQAVGGLLFSPFHAKFKVTEQTIVHGDLFAVAGAGRTFHDSVQGVTFQGGLGLRLYLMKRLSFRLDLRDFVLPQEVLGRARVTHNLTVLAGFGIWLG